MKFIHLSDLHIGKRVNEYSMIEDQEYILKKVLNIIDDEKPRGVFIAGDIYDKSVPSAEAVSLFDEFLVSLSKRNLKVFVISGNHDSPERIAFGGRIMENGGIFMSPVYDGDVCPVCLEDEFGTVNIFMLPFVKPVHVRRFNEDAEIESYSDAVRIAVQNMKVDVSQRNIMITHQFVAGAERTESEEVSVGGTDSVAVGIFDVFDYTALGHIHRAQNCGSEKVRYSGTPLKYSFSEAKDKKSVTVVELGEKGKLDVRTVELTPLRDMYEIRGKYKELMSMDFYKDTPYRDSYMHITLTDEEEIPDAIGKLRSVYHNIMKLDYDNIRTGSAGNGFAAADIENKSPFDHFEDFFSIQNRQPMNDRQRDFVKKLIEDIWEGEL